jgi:small subunit ribosomal protein S17
VADEEKQAAEQLVRDSGPVEGAPGEPGGSPGENPSVEETADVEETPAAEATEEAPAAAEAPTAEAETAEEPAAAEQPAAEEPEAPAAAVSEPKKKRKRPPRAQRHKHSKPKRERPAERKPITRTSKPESERGRRQERRGVVVASAMDKTIIVKVDTIKAHPRYKKVVRRSAKFHAHDEQNRANVGDVVRIIETRPLSKTKNWRLAEIVEAAR